MVLYYTKLPVLVLLNSFFVLLHMYSSQRQLPSLHTTLEQNDNLTAVN